MTVVQHREVAGQRYCDHCRRAAPPIRECALPYGEAKAGGVRSRWYDLCAACLRRVQDDPNPFVTVDTRFGSEAASLQAALYQRRLPEVAATGGNP